MSAYDLLIKNGYVIDPGSEVEGCFDIAIANGRIEKIATNINGSQADEIIDVNGYYVIPGIIDLHTHMSESHGGRFAHRMLAEAGITTTLDMSGPIESSLDMAARYGAGINMACLHQVRSNVTIVGEDPSPLAIHDFMDKALKAGALGCKILGGHYPLTQEATARIIEIANTRQAYVAFHVGTQKTGSDINGFLEAVELSAGKALHIAHINSYCRGQKKNIREEAELAVQALIENPNITSESYISPFNGTSGKCKNGIPESDVTKTCLIAGGYEATEQGLESAILKGWAHVNIPEGGRIVMKVGSAARDYWRNNGGESGVSFPINPFDSRARLATAKREDGNFVVECISTDGGGIPRNSILDIGLSLVKLKGINLREFTVKTSLNPAKILGLKTKGHFGLGMDADITVINLETQQAVSSFVNGKPIMYKGLVVGKGTNFITTTAGAETIRNAGLAPIVVNIAESGFYNKIKRKS